MAFKLNLTYAQSQQNRLRGSNKTRQLLANDSSLRFTKVDSPRSSLRLGQYCTVNIWSPPPPPPTPTTQLQRPRTKDSEESAASVSVCVCVKPRFQGRCSLLFLLPFIVNVQFATAGGPWAHGWHGPTKTHSCCREKTYLHKFLTYSKELMRLFKHSVALTFHSCGFASQVLSIHLKG